MKIMSKVTTKLATNIEMMMMMMMKMVVSGSTRRNYLRMKIIGIMLS